MAVEKTTQRALLFKNSYFHQANATVLVGRWKRIVDFKGFYQLGMNLKK